MVTCDGTLEPDHLYNDNVVGDDPVQRRLSDVAVRCESALAVTDEPPE